MLNMFSCKLKKPVVTVLAASLMIGLLSGCLGQGAPEEEEARVLRIGVIYGGYDGFDNMRSQYTDIWDFTHPEVELEFVEAIDRQQMRYGISRPADGEDKEQPKPEEQLQELMESDNPPDLVFFEQQQLDHLINENLLMSLDSYITEDEAFDTTDFAPAVMDTLRSAGSGDLYALAPTFTASALMFNRGLFLEHGVNQPWDGMSWEDLFDLAAQISGGEGDEQVYGFNFESYYNNDVFRNLRTYTAPLDLKMIDEENETMLVNNEAWANVFNRFIDLHEKGVFPERPDYSKMDRAERDRNPFMHDAFLSGKLAMTFVQYGRLDEVISANRNAETIEGFDYIDWDVVTLPTHPERPDEGGIMSMAPLMGINARAQNTDDAWALLSFINGEEWAKMKARSTRQLMTRTSQIETKDNLNYNIAAFTQLKPMEDANPYMYNNQFPYYYEIEYLGQRKFQEVLEGQKSVTEALQEWETEGNMAIQRYKDMQSGKDSDSGMSDEKIKLMRAAGEL